LSMYIPLLRCLLEPVDSLLFLRKIPLLEQIYSQVDLSWGVAVLRRSCPPVDCLRSILPRSYAGGQERGHIGLSRRIIRQRCALKPAECLLGRLLHSQPQGVHVSQISLRCRIALVSSFEEPMHSFDRILLNADAGTKGAGKFDLLRSMASFGA